MNFLLSSTVPDPSDFPPTTYAPGLRNLDTFLRCTICGELFDAPVTLPCGHCFCSFCARTAMAEKQECPACRKTANEGHLRPNPAMEDVVAAWKASRAYILKLSKEDELRAKMPQTDASQSKKRKMNLELGKSKGNSVLVSPSKQRRSRPSTFEDDVETAVPTSDMDEDEMVMVNKNPRPDDLVSCPLCSKRVEYKDINPHLDRGCQDPPQSKSHWDRIMKVPQGSKKGKQKDIVDEEETFPLPKASYATLKDKQLKEMLLEHNLPITGDRNVWIQRHQRWVMIWNANLDRSQTVRKTAVELKRELKRWEEEKTRKRKNVVEDAVAHQKRHKEDFAKLIVIARNGGRQPAKEDLLLEGNGSKSPEIIVVRSEEKTNSRYFG